MDGLAGRALITLSGLVFAIGVWGAAPASLQALVDQAAANAEVVVPKGTWEQPVSINKPLKLRGEQADACVLRVKSDQPALTLAAGGEVAISMLTIQWERATTNQTAEFPTAVFVREGSARLSDCRFQAAGGNAASPCAILVMGQSQATIERCDFDGFEFTVQFAERASGQVTDCAIVRPGHCGITVGAGGQVTVTRCMVTGSAFHAIRATGGRLDARDNLIVQNRNRGFYLGNRSASGWIINNVILGNGTGISAFGRSEVEIAHNLIAESRFAGVDARPSCRLRVHHNMLLDSTRGLALIKDPQTPAGAVGQNQFGANLFWGNRTNLTDLDPPPETISLAPPFRDRAGGDFALADASPEIKAHGLTNTAAFKVLWQRWKSLSQDVK